MAQRRFSRRALLAALGSSAAATAGCVAPTEQPETTDGRTSTGAGSGYGNTGDGDGSGNSDDGSGNADDGNSDPEVTLSGDDSWTTYGYEPGHSGYNPNATGPDEDPAQAWESGVEGIYTLREPAVAEGRVYVGSAETLYSFDAASGESAWDTGMDGMAHHFAPTYSDGTLYAVSKESSGVNNGAAGYVRAMNPESGGPLWSTSVPVTSTVTHDGDRLYVAAMADKAGYVRALDPETGDRGWRFDVPDASRSSITGEQTYADGTLYVAATHVGDAGSTTGALYALDPEMGAVNWTYEVDSSAPVAPVVGDGRVHLATRGGAVHAVSLAGDHEWTVDTGARIYTRPSYANGRLFVLTVDDIVAYDDGGGELWRAASERTQMTGMSIAGDTLYVGGEPLFALDVTDGSVVFDLPLDVYHGSYGAPVVVDDVLYAGICIKDEPAAMYDNSVRAYV